MLEITTLGQFEIRLNGEPVDIRSTKGKSLLAYLALTAGREHPRDTLAERWWPDAAQPRNNLKSEINGLRKAIGADYLPENKNTVHFNPEADYLLDATLLLDSQPDRLGTNRLAERAALYQGEFLDGFYNAWDEWAEPHRRRIRAAFEAHLNPLVVRLEDERRWHDLLDWGELWLAHTDLTVEPAYRALMRAAAAIGDVARVSNTYQRCRDALGELGLDPSADTRALYDRILANDEAATPSAPETRKDNLPAVTAAFVGRDRELADLDGMLARANTRLVTLVGGGGMGKTRLAIEAARAQLDNYAHGVYVAWLAPLSDPDTIVSAIASAIGLTFKPQPEPRQQLLDYLASRHMLLLLDNFEHLLDGAELVVGILQHAPQVRVLVTTRQKLPVQDQALYFVTGLPVPENTTANLTEVAVVQFFAHRARLAQPAFALDGSNIEDALAICRLVDGMPLGVELAASWLGAYAPAEIASALRQSALDFLSGDDLDLESHQRSMQAVFDRSWKLLSADEQNVLMRLSVFRGGFTREAAKEVAGASLRTLATLVNHSLITRDQHTGRFAMHELLRQYAQAQLESDEGAWITSNQHAAYFLSFAESQFGEEGPAFPTSETVQQFLIDHDNLRAALGWAIDSGDSLTSIRLLSQLGGFWNSSGHLMESLNWHQRVMTLPSANLPRERALLLMNEIFWKYTASQNRVSESIRDELVSLLPTIEEPVIKALACYNLNLYHSARGDGAVGMQWLLQGLEILESSGAPPVTIGPFYESLGIKASATGEYHAALDYHHNALAVRSAHSETFVGGSYINIGMVHIQLGEYRQAIEKFAQAYSRQRRIGRGRALIALGMANIFWKLDEIKRAAQMLGHAHAIIDHLGLSWKPFLDKEDKDISHWVEVALSAEAFEAAYTAGRESPLEETVEQALAELSAMDLPAGSDS